MHTALRSVTSTTLHTAKLFAVTPTTSGNSWRLVEQSTETDSLVDAIDHLWDKAMHRVGRSTGKSLMFVFVGSVGRRVLIPGQLVGVMEIGAVVKEGEMIREREEKIERKSLGW